MNEERIKAYLNLIQQLLDCPGEANQILNQSIELVDEGFVQLCERVAQQLQEAGAENNASCLRNLAQQVAAFLNRQTPGGGGESRETQGNATEEDYFNFLMEVLQTTSDSRGNPSVVYPLLQQNLDKLDGNFAQILQAWATETLSEVEENRRVGIAAVISELADLMQQFPLGSRADNLEIGIVGYEISLTGFPPEKLPEIWATLQYNLGNAYSDRIRGERGENLETAIACYQGALEVYTPEAFPQDWAMTQNNLGNAYSDRIRGERGENLETAIACFQAVLQVRTREAFPKQWAGTQNNLGNAYKNRIRGERAENLERAIACYEAALQVRTPEAFPQDWADTQNNLGNAYLYRIRGERGENLERALSYYEAALQVRTPEAFPQDWADTQNNLGLAYCAHMQGERGENLERAIACYEAALQVRTPEAFPQDWATTQNNLGNAYLYRIRGERAENLERAISCYQMALQVYTCKTFPEQWAMTQNNLGTAYNQRIREERAENLERAIACYESALQVYSPKAFPEQWAMTQNNLGNAYSNGIRGERVENLERAICYYEAALEVRTREAFPQDWASTQNNLGNAYKNRIQGEVGDNLERAIACYQNALQVRTPEAFPQDWASTQNNLGLAYCDRIRGKRGENLERAIACYQKALQVRTPEAFPENHAETLFNLGLAYRDASQLQKAFDTFAQAIDTVEFIRSGIIEGGEADKQKLAEEWNQLYREMVKVCLELENYTATLEYAERSKARNLVELLSLRDLYPKGEIPDEKRDLLQQLRREIEVESRRLATDFHPDYTCITQLRQQYNELAPFPSIQFAQIQQLLDENIAIIQWYIFGYGFCAFIVTSHRKEPMVWKSSSEDVSNLVDWLGDYLQTYYAAKEAETEAEAQQWQAEMPSRLQKLAEILHLNELLDQLPETCQHLILVPHIFLHVLPLHALPVSPDVAQRFSVERTSDGSSLVDCFTSVRYAPSCQLLSRLETQPERQFQHLFAIQTPTEDLYQDYEKDLGAVAAIKKQFTDSYILKKEQAKKSEILRRHGTSNGIALHEKLKDSHCAFFFCHGEFNLTSPLDSGLLLADGILTLADIIAHFDLNNCRLVTLSACETGIPDVSTLSDEYISLPYGFLLAGSTNVVASLWTVSAAATALLMLKFYQEERHHANIAIALNHAQRWLRDTTVQGFREWLPTSQLRERYQGIIRDYLNGIEADRGDKAKPFESPFYWAAFSAVGKGV
jgi:CHAT domain-containing protein